MQALRAKDGEHVDERDFLTCPAGYIAEDFVPRLSMAHHKTREPRAFSVRLDAVTPVHWVTPKQPTPDTENRFLSRHWPAWPTT